MQLQVHLEEAEVITSLWLGMHPFSSHQWIASLNSEAAVVVLLVEHSFEPAAAIGVVSLLCVYSCHVTKPLSCFLV